MRLVRYAVVVSVCACVAGCGASDDPKQVAAEKLARRHLERSEADHQKLLEEMDDVDDEYFDLITDIKDDVEARRLGPDASMAIFRGARDRYKRESAALDARLTQSYRAIDDARTVLEGMGVTIDRKLEAKQ